MATYERKTRRGRTVWVARVRRVGETPVSRQFDRRGDAEAWATEVERDIRLGVHAATVKAQALTVGEAIDAYLTSSRFLDLKPRSQVTQEGRLRILADRLASHRLVKINPPAVASLREELRQLVAPGTVNRYLAALSSVFAVVVEKGWLPSNPVRQTTRCTEPKKRIRFLSDEEYERLSVACRANPEPRLWPLVQVALSSGMRQEELLRMPWRQVDLDRGTVWLGDTKSNEERVAYVSGEGVVALHSLPRYGEMVWARPDGTVNYPRDRWEAARRQAGLEDFRFHDLRHTAATWLAMMGASGPEIAAFLGHAGLSLIPRYVHLGRVHRSAQAPRYVRRLLIG